MERQARDATQVPRRRFLTRAAALGTVSVGWRRARAAEEVRLGSLCELSGPASTIGSQRALGIKIAVEEINKTGGIVGKGPGIGGWPITLVVEDTDSKVATGLANARKLVERDRVGALTGIIFSASSLAVQGCVNKDGVAYVNAGSGNPAVSEPAASGTYTVQGPPNSRPLVLPSLYAAKRFVPRWFFTADDYSCGRLFVQLTKDAIPLDALSMPGLDHDRRRGGRAR